MTRQWQNAEAFAHPVLGVDGSVGITEAWRARNGDPPKTLLVRAASHGGKPKVLRSFLRTGDDEDFALTQKQLTDLTGGTATATGATVQYRKAGRILRFWYTPGAVLAVVLAVTAWLSTIATATFAYLRIVTDASTTQSGAEKTTSWLLVAATVVLGLAAVAASAKLVKDVRDARK